MKERKKDIFLPLPGSTPWKVGIRVFSPLTSRGSTLENKVIAINSFFITSSKLWMKKKTFKHFKLSTGMKEGGNNSFCRMSRILVAFIVGMFKMFFCLWARSPFALFMLKVSLLERQEATVVLTSSFGTRDSSSTWNEEIEKLIKCDQ